MAKTITGSGGDKRWSLDGTTALVTGGTRGIGMRVQNSGRTLMSWFPGLRFLGPENKMKFQHH
ncbi:hypothetical protein ACET3Z_027804 [Daucus carota]